MGFRENLKSLRKEQKLTQKALAELSGISYSMVSKLESGEQKNPSLVTLELLANALHVTVSQLTNDPDIFKQFNEVMGDTLESIKQSENNYEPYFYVNCKLREFLSDPKVVNYFSIGMISPEDYDDITKSIIDFIGYQFSKSNNLK